MMNKTRDWEVAVCSKCGQKLLVHRESGLCIWCHMDALETECEQNRREKLTAYNRLANERRHRFEGDA